MLVKIAMSGPMACGKTVLADKLAELIRQEAPKGTKVVITETTGPEGEPARDRHCIRETKFDV